MIQEIFPVTVTISRSVSALSTMKLPISIKLVQLSILKLSKSSRKKEKNKTKNLRRGTQRPLRGHLIYSFTSHYLHAGNMWHRRRRRFRRSIHWPNCFYIYCSGANQSRGQRSCEPCLWGWARARLGRWNISASFSGSMCCLLGFKHRRTPARQKTNKQNNFAGKYLCVERKAIGAMGKGSATAGYRAALGQE